MKYRPILYPTSKDCPDAEKLHVFMAYNPPVGFHQIQCKTCGFWCCWKKDKKKTKKGV